MSKKKIEKPATPNQFDDLFARANKTPGSLPDGRKLDVVQAVFLSETDWTLRLATVGRDEKGTIYSLSSDGWKPADAKLVAEESIVFVLPSLFAETVVTTRIPVLAKLPLGGRVVPFLASFESDVRRVLREFEARAAEESKVRNLREVKE